MYHGRCRWDLPPRVRLSPMPVLTPTICHSESVKELALRLVRVVADFLLSKTTTRYGTTAARTQKRVSTLFRRPRTEHCRANFPWHSACAGCRTWSQLAARARQTRLLTPHNTSRCIGRTQ